MSPLKILEKKLCSSKRGTDVVMDYYLNRFRSKVSLVAAQVTQVLPGNPVFREYEVHDQVGSAGPGLFWKIFSGTKISNKQVSFFAYIG